MSPKKSAVSSVLSSLPIFASVLLGAPAPQGSLHAADAAVPQTLRHHFEAGTTNAFKIELEIKAEGTTTKRQGTLLVVTRSADASAATVSLTANLRPAAGQRMMPPQYNSSWNPFELRVYGHPSQLPCQVEIDDRGRVLREMGELPLPLPFNELYRFLFLQFPENPTREWEIKTEQPLPTEGWDQRRLPPFYATSLPGARPPARMTAIRHERYRLLTPTGELTRCRYELAIDSLARVENNPRWQITGTGEAKFQPESGSLQELELQCTAAFGTETLVRRAPMVLRCQRVPVQQLETLLAVTAPKPPETLSEADVRRLLADLDSSGGDRSMKAGNLLLTANVPSLSPDLLPLLAERMDASEDWVRSAIIRLFAQHATPEDVPRLLGLLKSGDSPARFEAIKALGRLKEPRAAGPLAELVAQGTDYNNAVEALKQIGPPAEEAVLLLLQEKHRDTRRQACEILERIGARRSLEPLREAALSSDEMLARAARQASQETQARAERESQERR